MARKSPGPKKQARREDPALLQRLFEVHEELQVLCARWSEYPIGTCPSQEWDGYLAEQLDAPVNAIKEMTRSGRLEPKALRAAYDGMVGLKGMAQGQIKWEEAHARAVRTWHDDIEARLDRIIAGLRGLLIEIATRARR